MEQGIKYKLCVELVVDGDASEAVGAYLRQLQRMQGVKSFAESSKLYRVPNEESEPARNR